MEIRNWTQTIQRNGYTGVISGVKQPEQGGKPSASGSSSDTLEISEAGRQATMAAEMEKDGLSHEAAVKLASGQIKFNEPDWDTFEFPTLEVQADPKIYQDTYIKALVENLYAVQQEVETHYASESSKLQGMSDRDAMDYLFKTYKMPYMEDVFIPGTPLPVAPNGMSKAEADMAYDQLKGLRFGKGVTLKDPYALGKEGMERLSSVEDRAKETAQAAYDAAQKEVDARQEAYKAQRKEQFKQTIARINNGTGICMGYMALRPNTSEPQESAIE